MRKSAEIGPQTYGAAIGRLIKDKRILAGFSQLELALEAFEDEHKIRRIVELEKEEVANPQAKTIAPLIETLSISDSEFEQCRRLPTVMPSTQKQLGIRKELLARLAKSFDKNFPDSSVKELTKFLKDKAIELNELRSRLTLLRETEVSVDNQLAAAEDAIEHGRFSEAEEILSGCEEIQEEEKSLPQVRIQADIRAARGRAAQLNGKLEAAQFHFERAASFVDPFSKYEANQRRIEYASLLRDYGFRYGGPGIDYAIELLDNSDPFDEPRVKNNSWAEYQYFLGTCLEPAGRRTEGKKGRDFLLRAVRSFDACLGFFGKEKNIRKMASINNSKGVALLSLGERTKGVVGELYFRMSIRSFMRALRHYSKDAIEQMAFTNSNLGLVLWSWGERARGSLRNHLLAQSAIFQKASVGLHEDNNNDFGWAKSLNNLGLALKAQGDALDTHTGISLIKEAIEVYRAALTVRTEDDYPFAWALTQNNLGEAQRSLGEKTRGKAGRKFIEESIATFEVALSFHTEDEYPYDWALLQENLAETYLFLATLRQGKEKKALLEKAMSSVNAALAVYDPIEMDYDYGTAVKLRSQIEMQITGCRDVQSIN